MGLGPRTTSFLDPVNSVNALLILLREVYSHYINRFVLSEIFHYPDKFLHHLVRKNKGRVQFQFQNAASSQLKT